MNQRRSVSLRLLGVLLCGALLLALACTRTPAKADPPNIILISLDTLRRDAVGVFNPDRESQTPTLDALAARSVLFDDAWAQIPFTLPSHMSIFTGLYPDVHGVDRKKSRLGEGVPTLPALLGEAGYRNLGLVTNLWMKGEFGFDRGFDHYERLPYGLVYADRVNHRAFELIDAAPDDGRPLFLFVHYIDPHSDFFKVGQNALPYYAPPEYLAPTGIDVDSREFCDDDDNCATDFLLAADREQRPLDPETISRIAALYGRGVAYLDHQVGLLVNGLEERGLWDDSLVVITSDHGEEFREHGMFIHIQPFVENLAIPLMIKLPGGVGAGSRVGGTVETVDLLPTLLDAAGVTHPADLQGESLMPVMDGIPPKTAMTFGRDKLIRSRYSLRAGEFTLIHDVRSGLSELYHRASDPGETVDIASERPDAVTDLRLRLDEILADNTRLAAAVAAATESAVLNADEAEKLRAIGYVE